MMQRELSDIGDCNLKPRVSIIVPIYNEEKYIENCIMSILAQDYPKDLIELLLIDGGSKDLTIPKIKKFLEKENGLLRFEIIDNPKRIAPTAMNIGILESRGTYIVRMDAHSDYPPNYVSELIRWKDILGADNIGVACRTDVYNVTPKSTAIKKVLTNKFGVGNSMFRIGIDEPMEVDTVPFGCYQRELLIKIGMYDERLERNQDIELNKRIKKNGGKIFLVPGAMVTYYARETFSAVAKNNYGNGLWNLLTIHYTRDLRSLSLRHFVPFVFILSLTLPLILSLWNRAFFLLSILSFISYNLMILFQSIRMNESETTIWNLIRAFYTLHFSYGWGSFVGIFKILMLRIRKDK